MIGDGDEGITWANPYTCTYRNTTTRLPIDQCTGQAFGMRCTLTPAHGETLWYTTHGPHVPDAVPYHVTAHGIGFEAHK